MRILKILVFSILISLPALASVVFAGSTPVMAESFENSSFQSRGWSSGEIGDVVAGGVKGNALRWAWSSGNTTPDRAVSLRYDLGDDYDQIFVRFWLKYSDNWIGSGRKYHPHLIHFLSNADFEHSPWTGPSYTYFSVYMESLTDIKSPHRIRPMFQIQDGKRVNRNHGKLPVDISTITENRSVAGCNSFPNGTDWGDYQNCFNIRDDRWYSANFWKAADHYVPRGQWVKHEYWIKMNSVGTIGNLDGELKIWIDDKLVLASDNIVYRTAASRDTALRQLLLAPYIGDGSPINQSIQIDEFSIYSVNLHDSGNSDLERPTNLRVISVQ